MPFSTSTDPKVFFILFLIHILFCGDYHPYLLV
jgi:hypothetical protein